MEEPLYIFFDLEAAHSDRFFGDIIEIAAQVDPRMLENEVFSSLVNTKQNLTYFGKDYFVADFSMESEYLVLCITERLKHSVMYASLVINVAMSRFWSVKSFNSHLDS